MKQPYVSTSIQQDFTEEEKEQARENIGATQVLYVDEVGTRTEIAGDLEIVRSNTGLHLNDGTENISPLVPVPTEDDAGKVLSVDRDSGVIGWSSAPSSGGSVDMENFTIVSLSHNTNTSVLDHSYELPAHNGRYPSKVFGYLDVKCISPGSAQPSISVCMTQSYHSAAYPTAWDPIDPSRIANYTGLRSGSNATNHRTFMFDTKDTVAATSGVRYLTLKGRSECTYTLENLRCQLFYEYEEEGEQ